MSSRLYLPCRAFVSGSRRVRPEAVSAGNIPRINLQYAQHTVLAFQPPDFGRLAQCCTYRIVWVFPLAHLQHVHLFPARAEIHALIFAHLHSPLRRGLFNNRCWALRLLRYKPEYAIHVPAWLSLHRVASVGVFFTSFRGRLLHCSIQVIGFSR